MLTWHGFPAVFQVLMLAVFVALAIAGWNHYAPSGVNPKLYAKTNIVNLVIWGLWWPAIIWVTFWLGRAWCIVCPLEFVSSQAEVIGRKIGLGQMPIGGRVTRGSLVIIFFALLQLLVPGAQMHRVPHYTSLFLWVSLTMAFAVGLFYKDRAFCRGFCPAGLLLSAYGRGGMLAIRPSVASRRDTGSSTPNTYACPSLLNPAQLNTSKDCLLCGDCVKADTTDGMQLLLRAPYAYSDSRETVASWSLTLFVMIDSAFVTYELCEMWSTADSVFDWAPEQVVRVLNAGELAGWIKGAWMVAVVPLVLWTALGLIARAFGAGQSLGDAWRRLALPLTIVTAAGHMAKALEKFTSWVGFLPYAWIEPDGVQTAIKITAKTLPQPAAWFSTFTLVITALILIVVGIGLALREARLTDPGKGHLRTVPILLLGGFYSLLVFGWGGWIR